MINMHNCTCICLESSTRIHTEWTDSCNANRLVNQHSKHFVVAFGPWKANMNCNLTNCVFVLRNESLLLLITSLPDSWAECRKPWRTLECRFLELPQTSKTTETPLGGVKGEKTCLRDGHTIATTSRRPLTTTIFGVVAGGCRRSANVCRWSVTGCQRITSTTSRRPPTTTLFPGGFRWSANGCWWSPSSFGRPEVFDAASTTIDNQTRLPYKMNIHLILKNADDGEIEEE